MIKEKYIQITNRMLAIISEIEEFKASWKLLDKIQAEKLYGLKKIATIESIASSNRIEGNKLSDDEVEALLSNIKKQSFASRDEQEVMGYAKLMDTIFEDWEVIPLSENYIKQLHKILLQFSTKDEKHKGEYKKVSNAVAAYSTDGKELDIVFQTATPFETPYKMEELVNWTRKNLNDNFFHPLIVIGIFVVEFLAIHPFQDGNGRLSRALTCLLLLKAGYGYIPYSSMESIIEENKESYYRALRKTQTTLSKDSVDYEPWLDFFLKTM
ncbi:Fic family protein, partial [bacterium]|nr:Fic family protein [bacterium]